MHSPIYIAICALSLVNVLLLGIPDETSIIFGAALAIAVIGVPHGGLDHWTGRGLLEKKFNGGWWIVFFPSYLSVGVVVTFGWFLAPLITVVLFFLASAWHFGREEDQFDGRAASLSVKGKLCGHLAAAAIGGLVIWVPALARPEEFRTLLTFIVPAGRSEAVDQIVAMTRFIAIGFASLAAIIVVHRFAAAPTDVNRWLPLATSAIAVGLPILLSFTVYFCGWHSWRGLQRLRRNAALSAGEFFRSVAPLSVAAIVGVLAVGWWGNGWIAELCSDGQLPGLLRTMFIGLSAIAVPHLVLHELHASLIRSQSNREVLV